VLCALQFSRPMLCTWANTCISMGSILCNVCETLNALVLWPLGMLYQRVRRKHRAPVASESGCASMAAQETRVRVNAHLRLVRPYQS
jgi:hypothetical protein